MISRTRIEKKLKGKTNPDLVESIIKAETLKPWREIAHFISGPRRRKVSMNLDQIDKETKEGDTIVIPGKVLGTGNLSKRIRIAALSFSQEARKKLKAGKCEAVSISKEIEINKQAKGIKVLGR